MKLRALKDDDRELLAAWTARDPDHKTYAPDWIFTKERSERWMIEDSTPRLAFRVSRALRVDIQFGEADRIKTAKALIQGFAWLIDRAKAAGYTEVIFESTSRPLISFCQKRFGFVQSGNELVRSL